MVIRLMGQAVVVFGWWDQNVIELKEVFWTAIPIRLLQHTLVIKMWVSFAKVGAEIVRKLEAIASLVININM